MIKRIIAFIICFSLFPLPCYAFSVSSEACIVICVDTNQVLFGENINERLGMASTTKIMTAIIALEQGNPQDTVTISQNAATQEGSSLYLKAGEKVLLSDLLYGLMLNSGNDAAVAIAEHMATTEDDFVNRMNKKAKDLNMKNTHFENPCGLPEKEHYSTAYDMAILMSYALKNEDFQKIVGTKEYKFETDSSITHLKNHNKLLWKYPHATGGKTGFTKSSGRCLVSSAKKDGATLVCVTLNAPEDWNDHMKLLDYGFEKVEITRIIEKNQILSTRKFDDAKINILSADSYLLPLENGRKYPVTCKIKLINIDGKDIKFGTHLGYGDIYVGDYFTGRVRLISGQDISKTPVISFFSTFEVMLKKLFLSK